MPPIIAHTLVAEVLQRQQDWLDHPIAQVEYEFPPNVPVTHECRDLLCKILVADPARRISLPGIQQHPWYRKVCHTWH